MNRPWDSFSWESFQLLIYWIVNLWSKSKIKILSKIKRHWTKRDAWHRLEQIFGSMWVFGLLLKEIHLVEFGLVEASLLDREQRGSERLKLHPNTIASLIDGPTSVIWSPGLGKERKARLVDAMFFFSFLFNRQWGPIWIELECFDNTYKQDPHTAGFSNTFAFAFERTKNGILLFLFRDKCDGLFLNLLLSLSW